MTAAPRTVPGESLFPRLEPLLAQVQKPIQYVGGELNAQVKDWDDVAVRWALMYPDAYEVGLPNQGVMILYEVLNERAGRPRRAHLRRLARPRGAHARARRPAVHRRRPPRGRATSTCSASASPPSSATPTCSRRSTSPASRCTPSTATRRTRSSSPAGTPRSTPSRSPTSSTRRARRRRAGRRRHHRRRPAWKAQGRPGGRDELLARLARVGGVYVPRFYDVDYLPGRRDPAVAPTRADVPCAGRQAHRHGPRRVALPEAAAGAAGRDRARADERRDLPRLHPRLPLLPGRA